jgi:ATP-dependent DNA helicase RecQ
MFNEELWKEAIISVKNQFEIENLLQEQEQAIRAFFEKGNVFVNLPTGYGKSLIFQSLPIVASVLYSKPRGSYVLLVISPLRSLMEDQVRELGNFGIPAIAFGDNDDPEIIQQVINGNFILVYCSPESMLAAETWRGIFNAPSFKEKLIGVAIDEVF